MTPAVTAMALTRLAIVERSISTRIGHAAEKQADAGGNVLDCIDEGPIDFHFDWGRALY